MHVVHTIAELRTATAAFRQAEKTLALVPTMGNLHAGHISLVELANQLADKTAASIFVNPLQFGVGEDLSTYPRTLDADLNQLEAAGCDLVFLPSVDAMYPTGVKPLTTVQVAEITQQLCGHSRPTHFVGVTTVVAKLFNLFQPDVAVFGRKDYQQLAVIRRMAADLCFPIDIIGGEIVREKSGLAMSSRNHYLTVDERAIAPELQRHLKIVAVMLKAGERNYAELEKAITNSLNQAGFVTDYCHILTPELTAPQANEEQLVIFAAAQLGGARLIDNIEIVL